MDKIIEFEQEIDFSKADQKQLTILQEIIDANVQVSVKAEWDLSLITGKEYEHFIVKEEMNSEKKMIVSNELNKDYKESNLTLYPNPTSGNVTLVFSAHKDVKSISVNICDITGKTAKTFIINELKHNRALIDCSDFANGVYACTLVVDGKTTNSSKLVILK